MWLEPFFRSHSRSESTACCNSLGQRAWI